MKKRMFVGLALMLTLMSFSTFARDKGDKPIVRISIGNDRNQDLHKRVQRLEEAVRDLQDMVYDLQDDRRDRVVMEHVCSLKTSFSGTFIGKGSSRLEAEANAEAACKKGRASFCESTDQVCELTEVRSRR